MCNVYLIYLDKPIHQAKHYLGYSALESVEDRLARHKAGNGARLLQYANSIGVDYKIVRIWDCKDAITARNLERKLKNMTKHLYFKFLSPRGSTVYNDIETFYPLPHKIGEWGEWLEHPNPAK